MGNGEGIYAGEFSRTNGGYSSEKAAKAYRNFPHTYGGYSIAGVPLTAQELFSPYTRRFIGGLNNITLNCTHFSVRRFFLGTH